MMIETFVGMARYLSSRHDDDWSDRLHYSITPNILLAFSVLISFKQFGGRPIECMFPNKFPGSWEQYAENYCWSQDTYFVEPKQHVELLRPDQRYATERQLSYYQWVPFFLLLQAAFFRAPSFVWRSFSNHSGIRIHEVVGKAKDAANVDEEVRQKNITILARHLENALHFYRGIPKRQGIVKKTLQCFNYEYSSGFVSIAYLFIKVLYLGNVVLQLWLMNYFLGTNKHQWYGLGVIKDIINGVEWESSGYFPRSAICDFELSSLERNDSQSLSESRTFLYIPKDVTALLSLIGVAFVRSSVLRIFKAKGVAYNVPDYSTSVDRFVSNYLHRDGVFVLRMVSSHAGIIFGKDLIHALWNAFYGIEKKVSKQEFRFASIHTNCY
ncbi:unnamed protein product [Angiostrongylus costaricensis]|uniref:Innexin n=1 Tax=Angiostrongylus costaricensis TaxID=334426 RepID=A0A158PH25_ANGCS|nr:unnamed protein product [Angiostrongylus costaricensis]